MIRCFLLFLLLLFFCDSVLSLCDTERFSLTIFSDNTTMHVTLINFHLPRDVCWIKSRTSQGMSHCPIFLSNNSVPGHPPVFPPNKDSGSPQASRKDFVSRKTAIVAWQIDAERVILTNLT